MNDKNTMSRKRRAGVLLHPTSLPGSLGQGDIGHQAYRFIEFLNNSGFKVWQMLPLGPTHEDNSPYQCLSSHAGNSSLISLDWLKDKYWMDAEKTGIVETDKNYRQVCLKQAGDFFYKMKDDEWRFKINEFSNRHAYWLDDYALFMALKSRYKNQPWYDWPDDIRHRELNALNEARNELQDRLSKRYLNNLFFLPSGTKFGNTPNSMK